MTFPLMALAVGAIVAGFVGVPAALGGSNAIEHFLEPSFVASESADGAAAVGGEAAAPGEGAAEEHSAAEEIGLMVFSILVAAAGIGLAWRFYVLNPDIPRRLADRLSGLHRLLLNKYYVDELYNTTVVSGTMGAGRGLWAVDRNVVDGAVNGSGWVTLFTSWMSGLADRHIVDGAVNAVGRSMEESSYWFRRLQTGLVQNYALLMLLGIFVFVSVYLFVR
jgi:NADH-quinone oxidoreductase subunit L